VLVISFALALSACSLGPFYKRPEVAPPVAWLTADGNPTAVWPSLDWWRGFHSPELDAFIGQAQRANDDIGAAIARVREADAQARIAGAPLLPTVNGSIAATRERAPVSGVGITNFNQVEPLLSASYEIDFWGKNRALLQAARATAIASRYDRVTVELTVMVGVANSYFQILQLRDRLSIAEANLVSAREILRGLTRLQSVGTATGLDVAQQATTVATLYAAIPPLRQQLRQTTNALAILTGNTPESVEVLKGSLDEITTPEVQPGMPSEILARRPDVAEAEAQLIAANANIAAARAAFFPSISLTANGGGVSTSLASSLLPINRIWSVSAGLLQPIFRGGALTGQSDFTKARYTELASNYHKSVIAAFGNVEDALVAVQQNAERQTRQQNAVNEAQRAFDFAQTQMRAGTINVITLLNTQTALFTAQDTLAQVKFARLQAVVSLFQALGGGWQQSETPATAERKEE
jgi:multidrug efflux system outer membrane protein